MAMTMATATLMPMPMPMPPRGMRMQWACQRASPIDENAGDASETHQPQLPLDHSTVA